MWSYQSIISGLAKNPKAAGRGAELSATFALTEGDEIRVIVGQKGSDYPGKDYFGGSGGTFVVKYRVSFILRVTKDYYNFKKQ